MLGWLRICWKVLKLIVCVRSVCCVISIIVLYGDRLMCGELKFIFIINVFFEVLDFGEGRVLVVSMEEII